MMADTQLLAASPVVGSKLIKILIILSAAAFNRTGDFPSELTFPEIGQVEIRAEARAPGVRDSGFPRLRTRYGDTLRVPSNRAASTGTARDTKEGQNMAAQDSLRRHAFYGAGSVGLSALGRMAL
ncbi:hypothetical protein PT2222_570005 [Paraburkholderia tropica]